MDSFDRRTSDALFIERPAEVFAGVGTADM
jgi:hypothetical protein